MQDQKVAPTFFKSGDCRTISHQRKSWGLVHADLVRRTGLAREETDITSSRHLILLNLKGNSERGEYFLDAKPAAFVPRKPGAMVIPPDVTGGDGKLATRQLPIFQFQLTGHFSLNFLTEHY
jgi:hypothetical protein